MYRRRLRCKILQKKDQTIRERRGRGEVKKGPGCEGGSVGD